MTTILYSASMFIVPLCL